MSDPTFAHVHGYVRVRRIHPLLIWVAFKLHLGRFVIESGDLPHDAECTPTEAVLRSDCEHRDGYGSTLMPDRMCILCDREIPA